MKTKFITYGMLSVLLIANSCRKVQDQSEEEIEVSNSKGENGFKLEIQTGNTAYKYDAASSTVDKITSGTQTSSAPVLSASYIDKVAYYTEDISSGLSVTPSYDFFQGVQSPYDSNVWIYMERQRIGAGYHLYHYNVSTNQKTILISESNTDWNKLAFKPIGWSKEAGKVYMEALYLDNSLEHEGIWVYDLDKKTNTELELPFKSMRTPILTPDRDKFLIVGS
ncbi:MAG TPA: hypothetical protein VNI52_09860, partial [Sphingobacteriaceae bacterium]|nr:hypothetical protein [Sphingobacteriaceae bacterium]